jgi:hypothetical protein
MHILDPAHKCGACSIAFASKVLLFICGSQAMFCLNSDKLRIYVLGFYLHMSFQETGMHILDPAQ